MATTVAGTTFTVLTTTSPVLISNKLISEASSLLSPSTTHTRIAVLAGSTLWEDARTYNHRIKSRVDKLFCKRLDSKYFRLYVSCSLHHMYMDDT